MPEHTERGTGGAGGGDVHSRMSATGGTHEELDITYTPDREVNMMDRAGDQAQGLMDNAKDQAQGAMNQARDQAQNLASQAKGRAEEFRGRASDAVSRAKDKLEGTDAMGTIRDHPLPALGAAFALGFVLAGSRSRHDQKHGAMSMMRRQVRSAVMGGVSAAIAHEARSMMGMQGGSGGGGLLSSFFGGGQGGSSQGQGGSGSRSSGSTPERSQTQAHYH